MTPDDVANLLVVDDEQFLRDAVAASLRFLGFGVTAAEMWDIRNRGVIPPGALPRVRAFAEGDTGEGQ